MDLPFLFPQSRIFRAYGLTPDLKMQYGSDMNLVYEMIPENLIFEHLRDCRKNLNP
jgi:hypothetical protein